MRQFFNRYGVIGATIIFTVFSIFISVLYSALVRILSGTPLTALEVIISAVIPLILAPALLYQATRKFAELIEARDALQTIATIDPLTQVMNRATFLKTAEEALLNSPDAAPVGMVVMDIDRFKLINDTYGHPAGDEALRLIAKTISVHLREGDIFGRFGGDEFILLAPNTSENEIQELCHTLLTHIQTLSVGIEDIRTRLSSTMGVTSAVPSAASLNDLIARADAALLQAKRQGGGRVRYI